MDPRKLAAGLAVNRVLFGLSYLLSPASAARSWVGGRTSRRGGAQVFIRGHGARDVALGAAALLALGRGDDAAARVLFAGQAISDGADLAGTLLARDAIPAGGAAFGALMSGASTAVGAYAAFALGGGTE